MPSESFQHHSSSTDAERRDRDRRVIGADTTASHRQRLLLRAALAIGAAAILVGGVAVITADDGAISEARPFGRPEVDGTEVVVPWEGEPCQTVDTDRTNVVVTDDAVRATLYVDVPIQGCERHAEVERTHTFTLDRPLGDRTLIDGACLLPAFLDAPGCISQNVRLD